MNARRVLLGTGPLVALLNAMDSSHELCLATFDALRAPLYTCWPVVTEAAWMLRNRRRPGESLAAAQSSGVFEILDLGANSLKDIAAIMTRYESLGLQMADATLLHLADRESIRTIFTLDRRDFTVVRLKRNRPLRLIPEAEN